MSITLFNLLLIRTLLLAVHGNVFITCRNANITSNHFGHKSETKARFAFSYHSEMASRSLVSEKIKTQLFSNQVRTSF